MNERRSLFIMDCRVANNSFREKYRPLVKYKKKKNGQRIGVVVAFVRAGKICLGYSKCNMKLERFDKEIGLIKAIERAHPATALVKKIESVPQSMREDVKAMHLRAKAYFRRKKAS